MEGTCARLHVVAFGLALGITWAIGMFAIGLTALYFNYGSSFVAGMGDFYIGYTPTLMGAAIGAVWGFVDMFILGVVIAFFYNRFAKTCSAKSG